MSAYSTSKYIKADDAMKPILARIKHARKYAGMTLEQAGEHLHMRDVTLYMIESGRTQLRVDRLLDMARIYNVSPVWLLTGEED